MNSVQRDKLQRELTGAGASKGELTSLLHIAHRLGDLKDDQRPKPSTARLHTKVLRLALPTAVGLALGILLVISSQTVLPGNILYPIQKLSDNAAIHVDPSYRATVMMKTADQVQELVAHHASSSAVFSALANYQDQAARYKSETANYAAFDYCKHSLQLAAAAAPASERQAINTALQSLDNV